MVRAATFLQRLLCLGMALALLVPAAAAGAHNLQHGLAAAGIATDHADHVSPAAGIGHGEHGPASDKRDGGHDHQLSLSVPVGVLLGETPLVHPPLAAQAPPEIRVKRLSLRAADPPPADPPRSF